MRQKHNPVLQAETALSDWLQKTAEARRCGRPVSAGPEDDGCVPVRAAAARIFPSCFAEHKQIVLCLTNDTDQPFRGIFSYALAPTDGIPGAAIREEVFVPAQQTTQILFFDRSELRTRRDLLLLRVFDEGGGCLCETRTVFCSEKALRLSDPELTLSPVLRAGRLFIRVHAARYARRVRLHCSSGIFAENGFDLSAGEERTVELRGAGPAFTETLSATSLFDALHKKRSDHT